MHQIDTLPPMGGDTLWASAYEAYDRLSKPMQQFVEGLEAVHDGQIHQDRSRRAGTFVRRDFVESTHPVVRTHPLTGWKGTRLGYKLSLLLFLTHIMIAGLFVQPGFTKRIVGLSNKESRLMLDFLFKHVSGGHDFQLRFKWTEDTVAVWDNRATFHCAIFDYFTAKLGRRHGWRVTPTVSISKCDLG